jgi:hypothetical protein
MQRILFIELAGCDIDDRLFLDCICRGRRPHRKLDKDAFFATDFRKPLVAAALVS